jgi:hypothetical protein
MQVPPPDIQQNIMHTLRVISKDVNISEIMGPIIVLLIEGKLEEVEKLVTLYDIYIQAHQSIKQIVMATLQDVHALDALSTLDI